MLICSQGSFEIWLFVDFNSHPGLSLKGSLNGSQILFVQSSVQISDFLFLNGRRGKSNLHTERTFFRLVQPDDSDIEKCEKKQSAA